MLYSSAALICLVAITCVFDSMAYNDIQEAIYKAHWYYRKNAKPKPDPPLPKIKWSNKIEQEAKDWAKQCKWGLGPPGVAGYGIHNKYGQNTWATIDMRVSPWWVTKRWEEESDHYNAYAERCNRHPCGHYKQIVYEETKYMGCYAQYCTEGTPFNPARWGNEWFLWVCNYYRPSDFRDDNPPYAFKLGSRRLDESNHTAILSRDDKDAWRHYNSFSNEDDEVQVELENYGIPQLNELDPGRRRLRGDNNTLEDDEMTDEERHFDRSHSMTADDIVEDHDQDLAKSK